MIYEEVRCDKEKSTYTLVSMVSFVFGAIVAGVYFICRGYSALYGQDRICLC